MITTGKNLGEIVGEFGQYVPEKETGEQASLFVNANPKYGSEKEGCPDETTISLQHRSRSGSIVSSIMWTSCFVVIRKRSPIRIRWPA